MLSDYKLHRKTCDLYEIPLCIMLISSSRFIPALLQVLADILLSFSLEMQNFMNLFKIHLLLIPIEDKTVANLLFLVLLDN